MSAERDMSELIARLKVMAARVGMGFKVDPSKAKAFLAAHKDTQ